MARVVEPLRVGIYARISTHDQQTLPLQVKAMRQYARRRSWKVVKAVEDVGGLSKREIAKRLKVGRTSVRRVLTQKGPRP